MADAGEDAMLALQNRGPPVLIVTVILTCLSTVFVALRLVSRAGIVKRISNDDYAIIVAWVSQIHLSGKRDCLQTTARLFRFLLLSLLRHSYRSRQTRSLHQRFEPIVVAEGGICIHGLICAYPRHLTFLLCYQRTGSPVCRIPPSWPLRAPSASST